MTSEASLGKPGSARVKPLDTSDASEVDSPDFDISHESIQAKLVLRPWRVRFWDQFTALSQKQLLVYSRNARATVLRLLAPLFFMFILWLLNIALKTYGAYVDTFTNQPNPAVSAVGAIPACSDDFYIRDDPCWDFIYSPNTSAIATAVAEGMRLNNPGREIPANSVLGFASLAAANEFLAANPERVLGGVHFILDANAGDPEAAAAATVGPGLSYVLQVNSTSRYFRDQFQDPTFFSAFPLQVAAEREIARNRLAAAGPPATAGSLSWDVAVSQFAHPVVGDINVVGQAMGPFVFAANMFNFVLLLASVVSERELGLRQALRTAGMLDSAFWLSWAAVELAISVLFTLFTIAFGAMFQFEFFLKNSFAVVFLLFLLFQWAMVGVAFLLSTFISKTATAINMGFVIFIVGWVIQSAVIFGFPYTPDNIKSVPVATAIITLMPFAPLSKGSLDLGAAAEEGDGISWSRRDAYCQDAQNPADQDALYVTDPNAYWDFDCVFPLGTIMATLAIEALVYFLLAIYFDNILADENGVRKKMWYFLVPEYWRSGGGRRGAGKGGAPRALRPMVPCPVTDGASGEGEGDADVAAEEAAMRELLQHRTTGGTNPPAAASATAHAVEVFGLQKAFGKSWFKLAWRCMTCRSNSPGSGEFWAIKGSWLSIERGRLFCLLGPNGAGKTTTINCLTGVLPPTGGDALVYGESINSAGGMARIRAAMGVCPQFDVLWKELTGAEHLRIYGRVKGLSSAEVAAQSEALLESVKLTAAAAQCTGAYSGGMRRRLSVAIALLGDPLIVYLDEPTTGMDPISRRQVWDCIEAAKSGRAVVLTTHSMEEADILGDTIAIMARGRVRAYGSSLRLKQRFGSGYQLSVAVAGANAAEKTKRAAAVAALFKEELDVPAPEAGTGAYVVFLVPKDKEGELPGFLRQLEERRGELGVTDIQISLTSLEEVFLNIARRAELEAAAAEGRAETEVRLEDGSLLLVGLGAEEATQETTGRRYAIKWAQDEKGELSVLSWHEISGSNGVNGAAVS